MTTTEELRNKFISYFKTKKHSHQPGSSLVPSNDKTLLFTNAGMVQFKNIFLGHEERDFSRVATIQKCLRAGGKHNDLDNVGYTDRHHTFFEMLGNFSFGDYFKKEAISFAWEFLVKEINLPKEKLKVTIYADDDETFDIWHSHIGLEKEKIICTNSSDNFWSMGDTGPCGPCTEIFYDIGENKSIEIWNIVFMQYNRNTDGSTTKLPKPSVDTGMGLERISRILQQVSSNYEIDLFQALIKKAQQLTNTIDKNSPSLKVIADHIRSCAFLIADGVFPSNEGRGHVLRRIIRRAIYHGHKLSTKEIFFYKLVDELANQMGQAYPELIKNKELIEKTLIKEEELFLKTIENGIKIFESEIKNIKTNIVSGKMAFKLYDTYGFPLDLTANMAREKGLTIDEETFHEQMNLQKQRSKKADKFYINYNNSINSKIKSEFKGYSTLAEDAEILEIYQDNKNVDNLDIDSREGAIILNKTPFYPESGGQIGDKGVLESLNSKFIVEDVQKSGQAILHIGKLLKGTLSINDKIAARVDNKIRTAIKINHSATHLLYRTLKEVLGDHVEQKGSLVNEKKLRFDFVHNQAISHQQIEEIERLVNSQIRSNHVVNAIKTSQEKARSMGAEALFDAKYSSVVRIVSMGDFSTELCGGTHVNHTGEIGLFKITLEASIATNIRRIEAVTADQAINNILETNNNFISIKNILKANSDNILNKLQSLQKQLKDQEKQIAKLSNDLLFSSSNSIKEFKNGDITLVIANIDGADIKMLRKKADVYKLKNKNVIIVLSTVVNNKIQFVVSVSKNTTNLIKAEEVAKQLSNLIDGKSGGRSDMAQGGGGNIKNIETALFQVTNFVLSKINLER